MRPKKTVLLVCESELTSSALRFALRLQYRVATVTSETEALCALVGVDFDAVVIVMPGTPERLLAAVGTRAVRMDFGDVGRIRELTSLAARRKRGPKPKAKEMLAHES